MRVCRPNVFLAGLLLLAGWPQVATAQVATAGSLYSVELAREPGGTLIRGLVDTTANSFMITSWSDAPEAPSNWTPSSSSLPLTLYAYTSTGAPYDVPDNWRGSIGAWAFLLPPGQDLLDISWNEGTLSSVWNNASLGWGGLRNSLGTIVVDGSNRRLRYVPLSPRILSDIGLSSVTVTLVPEPSSGLLVVIGAAVTAGRWLSRRRQRA